MGLVMFLICDRSTLFSIDVGSIEKQFMSSHVLVVSLIVDVRSGAPLVFNSIPMFTPGSEALGKTNVTTNIWLE